jgi:hypothetical protein
MSNSSPPAFLDLLDLLSDSVFHASMTALERTAELQKTVTFKISKDSDSLEQEIETI